MGEKNNKYFLNLENSNKTKSSVRKILATDGALTSDPKKIMSELELYYSNLYDGRNCADTQTISSFINDFTDVPYLAEEKGNVCEVSLDMMNGIMYYRPSKRINRQGTMV